MVGSRWHSYDCLAVCCYVLLRGGWLYFKESRQMQEVGESQRAGVFVLAVQ